MVGTISNGGDALPSNIEIELQILSSVESGLPLTKEDL